MAKKYKEEFSAAGNVDLDMDDLIFGVQETEPGGYNFLFNSKVDKNDEEGLEYQYQLANLLGLVAVENKNMMNIIGKAFARAITEILKKEGERTDSIMIKIINENEKPEKFPKLLVTTNGKYMS